MLPSNENPMEQKYPNIFTLLNATEEEEVRDIEYVGWEHDILGKGLI
jgi:hypothetical protein